MKNSRKTRRKKQTHLICRIFLTFNVMRIPVYHLIIIDESGSMSPAQAATISGCNETLNSIRSMQKTTAEDQEHLVSIFLFQKDKEIPSRYIIKNCPIESVQDITPDQYKPWGFTPLYDAIGSTVVDLKACISDHELSIANVTVITDGYENASEHYSQPQVANMIEQLKAKGWNFNFIGANIDVEGCAKSMNFQNYTTFQSDDEGTRMMFEKENRARERWNAEINSTIKECRYKAMPREMLFEAIAEKNKGYYAEDPDELKKKSPSNRKS